MNKKEIIKAIYEKIADKTLSFGCVYSYYSNEGDLLYDTIINSIDIDGIVEIIGHPVMIGDVLDFMEKNNIHFIGNAWHKKRKPIEEQSEECIEYIYNLIN